MIAGALKTHGETDAELLQAWRAGDRSAGSALFERYFEAVYRFFWTKVPDQADDLVQQTFLACVRSRDQLREGSSFRSFLFITAQRKLFDGFRRTAARPRVVDLAELSLEERAVCPNSVLGDRERVRLILSAMRTLPTDLQVVMELYHFEGLRGRELTEALPLAPGTIRSRLRRGLQLLKSTVRGPRPTPGQLSPAA